MLLVYLCRTELAGTTQVTIIAVEMAAGVGKCGRYRAGGSRDLHPSRKNTTFRTVYTR